MDTNIDANKIVYNKTQLDKVIDRSFNFYLQKPISQVTITVPEFFDAYEKLYYEIPPLGTTESHQYLIKRSSELVSLNEGTPDIQPLLDEIAQLREQILSYQNQLIKSNTPA